MVKATSTVTAVCKTLRDPKASNIHLYDRSPRMLPQGMRDPGMVQREMVIQEMHLSQVAGAAVHHKGKNTKNAKVNAQVMRVWEERERGQGGGGYRVAAMDDNAIEGVGVGLCLVLFALAHELVH